MNNKISNSIKIILALITIMISVSSCEDFLDQKPEHQVLLDDQINNLVDIELRLYGVYKSLQSKHYYGRTFPVLPEIMSDNSFIEANNNRGDYLDFDNYILNTQSFDVENQWTLMYRAAISANIILVNLSSDLVDFETIEELDSDLGLGEDEEEFKNLIGELLAVRALAYFDLVRMYAQPYNYTEDASHSGIPVISLEETRNMVKNSVTINPSRKTVKEVYNRIKQDLDLASRLISTEKKWYRFDYYSVKALQSRIFLYTEEWDMAKAAANQVIENGNYSLVPTQDYLLSWTEEYTSETIFSIPYTVLENNDLSSFGYFYAGTFDGGVSQDFYDKIPEDDVRKLLYTFSSSRNMYLVRNKYDALRSRPYKSNFPLLRLSEIYLNRAEASARLNDNENAIIDLNIIRSRGLPLNTIDNNINSTELLEEILKERRIELGFEGHRLFDLTRYKKHFYKYKNREEDTPTEILYPNFKTILPIPQEEMDTNFNLIQNPGY